MSKPKLYTPEQRSKEEIERLLSSQDSVIVCRALTDAAKYEADWRWTQQRCLDLLRESQNRAIRIGSIHGLQFLTAARGKIDPDAVIPALLSAKADSDLAWFAGDALDDIYYKFPSYRPSTPSQS